MSSKHLFNTVHFRIMLVASVLISIGLSSSQPHVFKFSAAWSRRRSSPSGVLIVQVWSGWLTDCHRHEAGLLIAHIYIVSPGQSNAEMPKAENWHVMTLGRAGLLILLSTKHIYHFDWCTHAWTLNQDYSFYEGKYFLYFISIRVFFSGTDCNLTTSALKDAFDKYGH